MREVKPPELGVRAQAVLDLDLPSMAEVTARPLVTEARVPANVRAKWAKCFAKLCSDAVYHKDNAKFWVTVPPREGAERLIMRARAGPPERGRRWRRSRLRRGTGEHETLF